MFAVILVAGAEGFRRWRRNQLAQQREAVLQQERRIAALEEQHQLSLAQVREQQQALFDSMLEGVLVLDHGGRVQSANQSLKRLFGLSADIRDYTILEAFRLHELAELVERLIREGTVRGFELVLPALDRRCLEVNAATLFDHNGQRAGVVLVFHDLTRLKQLENTRQEFVANVSHELRTPLSLIKGFVETLLDGAKDNPAVATRFLQTIEKHADRLTYLIEDLLTISHLESGQIVMNLQPVELRPAAQRVLDDLQSRANDKPATLLNEIPEGFTVRADIDRLQQILFNLVENAIKYGRKEGHVRVGATAAAEDRIEVWVRDDGPGIPVEARERVFERFYRVDKARSRESGGTGLGLSIVKHIVQAHGGEVWVHSQPGQGAAFHFTLAKD